MRVNTAMASSDVNDIELMRDEAGGLLYETSIATITFFRGDIVGASQALRAQFDKVVRANPWLAGRLVRDKTSKGKLVLRHPVAPTEAHIDAVFASDHAEDVSGELSLGVPYPKLCKALFAKKRENAGENAGETVRVRGGDGLVIGRTESETSPQLLHNIRLGTSSAMNVDDTAFEQWLWTLNDED